MKTAFATILSLSLATGVLSSPQATPTCTGQDKLNVHLFKEPNRLGENTNPEVCVNKCCMFSHLLFTLSARRTSPDPVSPVNVPSGFDNQVSSIAPNGGYGCFLHE